MKKILMIVAGIVIVGLVLTHFVPQEMRPAILRCSGCWYGNEYICGDEFLYGGMPPNADGTCQRNFGT